MQHGLQGSSFDFMHWRDLIQAEFPDALVNPLRQYYIIYMNPHHPNHT